MKKLFHLGGTLLVVQSLAIVWFTVGNFIMMKIDIVFCEIFFQLKVQILHLIEYIFWKL